MYTAMATSYNIKLRIFVFEFGIFLIVMHDPLGKYSDWYLSYSSLGVLNVHFISKDIYNQKQTVPAKNSHWDLYVIIGNNFKYWP